MHVTNEIKHTLLAARLSKLAGTSAHAFVG
jgi:hypothetical protein